MKTQSNSKDTLARLLATENINIVVSPTAATAGFDLKARTLILPNWENTTGSIQNLLIGHEVGHALFTGEQGWHNAVTDRGAAFKSFLNVVEDARIEKKIKRKYPGLRKDFQKAYAELYDMDFFGLRDESISKQILIDRVNVYFKLGHLFTVPFTPEEQVMVDQVAKAESWEDVVAAAEALFAYCKKEQQQKKNQPEPEDSEEYEDDLDYSDEDTEEEEEDNQWTSGDAEDEEPSDLEDEEDGSSDTEETEGEEESDEESEGSASGGGEDEEEYEPESKTDKAFRAREESLADSANFVTVTLPSVDLDTAIMTSKEFVDIVKNGNELFYTPKDGDLDHKIALDKFISEFYTESKGVIDLYVKEFQMRKSAGAWKKARTSDTGDINPAKLSQYKLTDQVFKSRTIVPNGKNHGMVMLLDLSGSMARTLVSSMKQVMVLASFCKRVAIPFQVYGFTDNNYSPIPFQNKVGDIQFKDLTLIDLLSSDMRVNEYNEAIRAMFLVGISNNMYNMQVSNDLRWANCPAKVSLGSTPLCEALTAMHSILPKFQKKNRVEVLNLVVVTDGEEDNVNTMVGADGFGEHMFYNRAGVTRGVKLKVGNNFYNIAKRKHLKPSILKSIKDVHGVNILGFFLLNRGGKNRHDIQSLYNLSYDKQGQRVDYQIVRDKMTETGFYESFAPGYDRYFLMYTGEAKEIEIQAGATKAKIKSAFVKNNRNKKTGKVLASKFMEIAA